MKKFIFLPIFFFTVSVGVVSAASLVNGVLSMLSGEQVSVVCSGGKLNVTTTSTKAVILNCLAATTTVAPTPSSTPVPTSGTKVPGIGAYSGCSSLAVATNKAYDAGLNENFVCPMVSSGKTVSVTSYGATANNANDNDAPAIQNAINAAGSGDVVVIPSGTFHVKSGPIVLKTGVSVRGASTMGSILATQYSSAPNAVFSTTTQGGGNFTLSNFRIQKSSGAAALAGIRLGTGNWEPTASNSVYISRVLVENTQIEGYERFGIQIENGKNILVQNNRILNATAESVGGQGYGVMIGMSASSNNWVRNNDVGPAIRHAYLVQYRAHHNLFEYNIAQGTSNDSFDFHGEKEYSNELRYNLVDGCNLTLNPTSSISAFGVGEVPSGNDLSICHTDSGAHCDTGANNWIHHNTARGCKMGVRINLTNNTIVEDNMISNMTQDGIVVGDLSAANSTTLARNTTSNNPIGIWLKKTNGTKVLNSKSTNNTNYGISSGSNSETTQFTITGNDFRSNTNGVNMQSTNGTYANNQQ